MKLGILPNDIWLAVMAFLAAGAVLAMAGQFTDATPFF